MCKKIFYLLFLIFLFLISCEKDQNKFLKENKNQLLKVFTDTSEIEADGTSKLNITAVIPDDVDTQTISFKTTDGSFSDSAEKTTEIKASFRNDSLLASTHLISSLEINDEVMVMISVKNIDTTFTVKFIKAFPESITLEPTVHSIKTDYNSTVPVQIFLTRSIGIPSLHSTVDLKAITDNNIPIGNFKSIDLMGSNSSGLINGRFVLEDTSYMGTVRLIASTVTKTFLKADTVKILVTK